VVIPEDAILPLQSQVFVWVITDGQATRREVELGVRTPGFVEIKSGVEVGEQVVVGGLERLFEGAPVMPTLVERRPGVESPAVEAGEPSEATSGEGMPEEETGS
jgi:membrane fusion protein (multidrug efflux system)